MAWFLVQGYPLPMSGNRPDNTLPTPPSGPVDPGYSPPWATPGPGQPPYPSTGPGFPTHPIAGPGRPPWWGMANDPGYSPPWATPGPGGPVDPGYSPPWAQVPGGGQPPLGIWGPTDPRPTPPIYIPITPPPDSGLEPTHPIYIPVYPSTGPGFPTNPIANPGDPNNPGGSAKAEIIKAVKAAVSFWTGNLPPPPPGPNTPTPVTA